MEDYDFAIKTVRASGELLLQLQREGFETMSKGGNPKDIVTSADRALSDFITQAIRDSFPTDAIHSEEAAEESGTSARRWVIDPIDGSSNFARGIPHFAICLGLLEDGVAILGAVYNPITNELFSFRKGEGAFLNDTRIHVSKVEKLSEAYVFLHAGRKPEISAWGGESYRRLLGAARKTSNLASSALDTCFVAAGRIEANVYGTFSTLDIAGALGILEEAGGVIRSAAGEPIPLSNEPQRVYMANSESMLAQVRTLLEST